MADVAELARRCFAAFVERDRAALEALLAPDFTFTSPYDDAIDRATFFERCWPNGDRIRSLEVRQVAVDGEAVFVRVEVELPDGTRFRNVERLVFRGGLLRAEEVYFGDPPSGVARADYAAFLETAHRARAARPERETGPGGRSAG